MIAPRLFLDSRAGVIQGPGGAQAEYESLYCSGDSDDEEGRATWEAYQAALEGKKWAKLKDKDDQKAAEALKAARLKASKGDSQGMLDIVNGINSFDKTMKQACLKQLNETLEGGASESEDGDSGGCCC
eukprot:TRINITY_DN77579_c0_g1_i1.p2 TRINITY_DN77579_c0_g1~~TRINITY_DN77579_c0_g1_i1.p2  ORF type:complete len:129 (+),score=29.59 TRINITY_DN77579_c0_g1_i1:84-470(+)